MAYDPPTSSTEETTWTVSARFGTVSSVTVAARIIIEDVATEADADAALQDVVNALSARGGYSNVTGVKSASARETRQMQPS
ncbi:hypothetical protein ACWD5V_09560 [Streptomyces sp. NPDC002523]